MDKKEKLTHNKIKTNLKNFYKKNKLKEKNPYKEGFLDDVVDNFCDALKNEKEFSWLSEFGINDKENDKANVNYGLPTHVHGDYENGLIYLCLINPGDQVSDDKSFENIRDYYDAYAEKTRNTLENINKSQDKNIPNYDEDRDYKFYEEMNKNILTWKDNDYNLNDDLKENIKEYIFSKNTSILTKELIKIKNLYKKNSVNLSKKWEDLSKKHLISRNAYYTWTYFKPLFMEYDENIKKSLELVDDEYKLYGNSNEEIEGIITNKIVNLELCPFRSQNAKSVDELNRTIYSEYSAYIIWNRIGKYLKNKQERKPKFAFRSYDNWMFVLRKSLFNLVSDSRNIEFFDSFNVIDEFIEGLLGEYFFIFSSNQNATLSQNNLLSYEKTIRRKVSEAEYQEFVDVLNNESN